jgi:hypothetical protein
MPKTPVPAHVRQQVDALMKRWPRRAMAFYEAVEDFGYEGHERMAPPDAAAALAHVAARLRQMAVAPPHGDGPYLRYLAAWIMDRRRAVMKKPSPGRPRRAERVYNRGPEISGGLPETNRRRH